MGESATTLINVPRQEHAFEILKLNSDPPGTWHLPAPPPPPDGWHFLGQGSRALGVSSSPLPGPATDRHASEEA